ncbi:dnaJ homolog subfamily B member 9 [Betta splendens]|uniref:DnaJ homolog subfamily B member 9 n=1 Tax=Betta splendens TaxID=158456 RepID=A0A6P7MPM2_BETSP|nr:dnaJ homolog subfamily B member 9 [Betta splendens]
MAAPADLRWMRAAVVLLLCVSEARPAAPDAHSNYYETLNVEPAATDTQIKKAFRKLAAKYHPDKNRSADAEKTFREIAEAYSVLSDKEKRKLYDSVGHDGFLKNAASVDPEDEEETSFHFSFSDVFHDFEDVVLTGESHTHWSFHHEDREDGSYEQHSFEGPDFNFFFMDEDQNEEVHGD